MATPNTKRKRKLYLITVFSFPRHTTAKKWTNQLKEVTAKAQQLPPIVNFTEWLRCFLYCLLFSQCTVQTTATLWHSAHSATARNTAKKFIEIKFFFIAVSTTARKTTGPFYCIPAQCPRRTVSTAPRAILHTQRTRGQVAKFFINFYTPLNLLINPGIILLFLLYANR